MSEYTKDGQKPQDDANNDDDIQDLLNLSVHRQVGIDYPKEHADNHQGDDERNQ